LKSLLTIIIPTKNRAVSLKKIINTLSKNKEINIIIIDDGSNFENNDTNKRHLLKNPNIKNRIRDLHVHTKHWAPIMALECIKEIEEKFDN
jgi:hypothetical protein